MILIPILTENNLSLSAYSFQDREMIIVKTYLEEGDFQFIGVNIPADKNGRKGIAFNLTGADQISRLEATLGVTFQFDGSNTDVSFQSNTGIPYRCVRLKHMPWEKGCENITASDEHAAFIKCALLANKNNWFAADSEYGICGHK